MRKDINKAFPPSEEVVFIGKYAVSTMQQLQLRGDWETTLSLFINTITNLGGQAIKGKDLLEQLQNKGCILGVRGLCVYHLLSLQRGHAILSDNHHGYYLLTEENTPQGRKAIIEKEQQISSAICIYQLQKEMIDKEQS